MAENHRGSPQTASPGSRADRCYLHVRNDRLQLDSNTKSDRNKPSMMIHLLTSQSNRPHTGHNLNTDRLHNHRNDSKSSFKERFPHLLRNKDRNTSDFQQPVNNASTPAEGMLCG